MSEADSHDTTIASETPATKRSPEDILFDLENEILSVVEYISVAEEALASVMDDDDTLKGVRRLLSHTNHFATVIRDGFCEAFPHGGRAA